MNNLNQSQAERVIPLLIGLSLGMLLVSLLATVPAKWGVFIVGGTALASILTLTGVFSNKLRGTLLFLAVISLPSFYGINFLYREGVRFSVLANGFPINTFDVAIFPLVLSWLYQRWTKNDLTKIEFPRVWLAILLMLLVINVVSALFVASEPFFSFSMIFTQVKCYFVMFFLANYVRDEHKFRVISYAVAGILIVEGVIVLEQRFLGLIFTAENLGKAISLKSVVGTGALVRLAGTLNHPNDLAMYLNLCLPLAGFLFIIEKKPKRKIYLAIAVLLGLTAELWTGSRGGWLGLSFALATGFFFWMRKQGKNPVLGLLIGAGALSVIFAILFFGSQIFRDRLVEGDAGAAEVRFPLMEVAMEMIKENPILGVGLNLYTREMVPYDRTNHFIAYRYNHPVHNTFLMVAAETGLPSLLLFATLIMLMIKECHRIAMKNDGIVSVVGIGMLGTLISWFMHNQVNLTSPFNDPTLWALLGMVAAASNYTNRKLSRYPNREGEN